MFSRVTSMRGIALIVFVTFGFGCAETARLRGSIATTTKKLEQTERNGAYVCAPKELAMAKTHLSFAQLEIEQGRGTRARYHFEIAVRNAELAHEKSPADKCAGPAVVVAECVDGDRDGVCDNVDLCPDQPEDFDGVEDGDGCPEDQDTDGDGIPDSRDQCVLDPEDTDNYLDDDGCPDTDNDVDGVTDSNDRCINDPEDPDGYEDTDGCPDNDNDQDTVLDIQDECPNIKGDPANNGCPKKYEGVEITETHIRINQKIHFAYNKAIIKKSSYWILSQVAMVLGDNPEITLSIEGHTDSRGGDAYNKKLSTRRAKAVMNHLVKKNRISRRRLTSKGWGESKPIDTNLTDEGRAANRRVEFVRTDVPPKK
ncbi:MAG: OmpA family protein [Proteobacteria bacterium]|nr:OmpA family protein [Pseudomonadota bacterium]